MDATRDTTETEIRALICDAADRHGVPRSVALAFSWCESRFNPDAAGDLEWSTREQGKRYKQHVLGSPGLRDNPARLDPAAWHSYGLFQLLAPYHVAPTEHPQALYDPARNAERGVAYIRRLLKRTHGDVQTARLLYVGLPLDGASTQPKRAAVLANIRRALELFANAGAP